MMSHYQQKLYDVLNMIRMDRGMEDMSESMFMKNYPTDAIAEREYRKFKPSRERQIYADVGMSMDNSGVGRRKKHGKVKAKRCKCK